MSANIRTVDLPARLNGHVKGIKGVYVPSQERMKPYEMERVLRIRGFCA